jgi:DNA-binding NtrC family response regulator
MTKSQPFRVLLVDDDPDMLRLLETILKHGFPDVVQVQTASNPIEARQHLESELVDLLVTDLEMPGISGLELLLCAKRKNAWTQVLLVTGHSKLDALMDAMEFGANDYLLKPLDPGDLKEAVTSILRRAFRWRESLAGTMTAH